MDSFQKKKLTLASPFINSTRQTEYETSSFINMDPSLKIGEISVN